MKKTLQDQYLLIKEGKGHKGVFLTEAKRQFPNIVRNAATFEEAAASLKTKNIISENVIGLTAINSIFEPKKKESYEVAYEAFLAEAKKKENEDEKVKAEEKKVSKKVEEDASHNFDNKDDKNIDNLIFDQVMTGYYAEMKDPKNADKTMQELKDIVMKNLQKDPIFYTKDGQFGVKDLGYTMDAPGLGEPKEPKGKWKASGYGDLKEGQVDMNKSYPTIKNNGTKIEYKDKSGTISGNFMVGGDEFASYKVKFDDGTTDEISTADKNIKFLEESLEESKLRKVIHSIVSEELNNKDNNILYLNRVRDAVVDKSPNNTLDNPTRAKLLSAINALDHQNIDLYSLMGDYDTKTLHTLEGIFKQVDDEFYSDFTDPAGGSGLASHLQESKLRKVIREMIDAEIEEAYQLVNIDLKAPKKDREDRDPTDKYLTFDKDFEKDQKRKENIIVKDGDRIFITKVLHANLGPNSGNSDLRRHLMDRANLEPAVLGGQQVWKIKGAKINSKGNISIFVPVEKSFLKESVEKELAAINKEAEYEIIASKLEKVQALIDKKQSQISRLDEDEDLKDLTDAKKVKEISKDIKALEKAKAKLEKIMNKGKGKAKLPKKEVIDEMDMEPSEEYMAAKEDAESRYEEGEEIDSIISTYHNLSFEDRNLLRQDLEGKMDGMDY